ncbi:hypothetical protein [Streptomyces sp. NPDC059092]|uniref:hypothetical protein n=1 Tax=Streptomyces sp. NPDC059092 TaxID=3346725 RepID=UPI003686170B
MSSVAYRGEAEDGGLRYVPQPFLDRRRDVRRVFAQARQPLGAPQEQTAAVGDLVEGGDAPGEQFDGEFDHLLVGDASLVLCAHEAGEQVVPRLPAAQLDQLGRIGEVRR